MTDKELLELAAKVAGYNVMWNEPWRCFQHHSPRPDRFGIVRHVWNPLTDDGDALRLAVKLRLMVSIEDEHTGVEYDDVIEEHNGDLYAATRRAIVRVAAEIGRNMT